MPTIGPKTLCWDCRNSVDKGCDWAREFKPVTGWDVTEQKDGYLVKSCPLFIRDAWDGGQFRTEEEYKDFLKRRRRKNEQADYHWEPDQRP